jgi:polysaccharide export outer membrane protein
MRFLFPILIVSLVFVSCRPQRAVYNYLEDVKDTSFRKSVYIAETVIQKNDLLSINITSASLDPKIDMLYNQQIMQGMAGGMQQSSGQIGGYLVDVNGDIELPRIGKVHAEGLKKGELEAVIKSKLEGELSQPNVIVRFLNFRITVLGEVGSPGVLNIPTERLSILEAVGMAGGVTEYGQIRNVKILRENNGVRELGVLDLTSQSIFTSPYYQLQQNDVVLVDQTRYKLRHTEQQRVSQQIGFVTGIVSTVAIIVTLLTR